MGILVVGLNHKTAPVEVREKLAFNDRTLPRALIEFRERVPSTEAVILSTCNRVEMYGAASEVERCADDIVRFLADTHSLKSDDFLPHLYRYVDRDAVRHLFTVTCSLDSMVVGEAEVLGQVKRAYMFSLEEGMTGKVLNALFQRAFAVAKNVRTSSSIGERKVSVASVAVEFAEKIFSDFTDKTVMIIGAGEMGELTLRHMVEKGVNTVIVANRTYQKAVELAQQYDGMAITYESFLDNMHRADVVITTSGAPHYIIHAKQLSPVLHARRNKPMLLIDIAVPRDIHPDVENVENVYLYNIDDLEKVVNENLSFREKELEQCAAIIEAETDEFMGWLRAADVGEVIAQFRQALHGIRESELTRTLSKLPELGEREKREIEYLTERIVNKILNEPTQALKQEASGGAEYRYIEALKNLFDLK
ncbi:MAG: glutamyl-tRNA reductase [Candidatus Abyssobacteria bacterium SURF_17]|jgi:glutamyl-tRNA reductase|uniref:Glutamyl-tRNA reductase n=1 Tax=Candidatus Abyssobacteria bacterium SURF_17 TaxID=2093361 RepID=A0A419F1J1_9BACT|nr:MAG: glutamyl-tRNA reductase [Candidatus Abyssubacteria bacterium SURF_17]